MVSEVKNDTYDWYSTEKIKSFTTRLPDLSQKEFDKQIFFTVRGLAAGTVTPSVKLRYRGNVWYLIQKLTVANMLVCVCAGVYKKIHVSSSCSMTNMSDLHPSHTQVLT